MTTRTAESVEAFLAFYAACQQGKKFQQHIRVEELTYREMYKLIQSAIRPDQRWHIRIRKIRKDGIGKENSMSLWYTNWREEPIGFLKIDKIDEIQECGTEISEYILSNRVAGAGTARGAHVENGEQSYTESAV